MTGYAWIFGIATTARILLAFLPVTYVTAAQQAVWSWRFFAVFTLCFWAAVLLAARSGLPAPAQTLSGTKPGWALPMATGAVVGVLLIASDVISPAAQARGLATLHVTGLGALPFYAYGAILLTTVFHFLPLAVIACLMRRLRGAARRIVLLLGVVAIALNEDAGYLLRTQSLETVEDWRHVLSALATAPRPCSFTALDYWPDWRSARQPICSGTSPGQHWGVCEAALGLRRRASTAAANADPTLALDVFHPLLGDRGRLGPLPAGQTDFLLAHATARNNRGLADFFVGVGAAGVGTGLFLRGKRRRIRRRGLQLFLLCTRTPGCHDQDQNSEQRTRARGHL